MTTRLQFDDLSFHHTAGVVHLVGVDNDADADTVAAVIRFEFDDCHAWALVIEVPEAAPFAPADTARVAGALNRNGDNWKICLDLGDSRDLARLWHIDGHEVSITRP
ncbi:MAG: hypothetical protein WD990_12890 [Acidimicrobiia bacterium]